MKVKPQADGKQSHFEFQGSLKIVVTGENTDCKVRVRHLLEELNEAQRQRKRRNYFLFKT